MTAAPVAAEPGVTLSIASDDRFRGQSTSAERPVATVTVSYDDRRGPYLGGTVTAGPTRDDGLRVLRSVQYAGYAHRLPSGIALDIGVTNRLYARAATVEYARRFTQGYVGVIGRRVSAHLFYSPNYDGYAHSATYGEVEALLLNRGDWSLDGHAGLLSPPKIYARAPQRIETDWRLTGTRRFGRSAASLSFVGGGPDGYRRRYRTALVIGLSRSF